MFLENNKGLILQVSAILIILAVTGLFMYQVRPNAVIIARGSEGKIELDHLRGEKIDWVGFKISVTEGRNSKPVFLDPMNSDHPIAPENKNIGGAFPVFLEGSSVTIVRTTTGKKLEEGIYHVVLKHEPTGTTLVDMNARVREER